VQLFREEIMSPKISKISVAVMGVLLTGVASSADMPNQSNVNPNSASGSGGIKAGGFEIAPKLALAIGKNDNVGLSSGVKTSSTVTSITPSIVIGLPTNGQLYSVSYSGNFTQYTGSTQDNFTNHNLGVAADNVWSARVNSLVNLDYVKGHDGRNSLLITGKEVWHTTGVRGRVHYGAAGAQGQFELAAGQLAKRYDSNGTGRTQLLNYDRTDFAGTFFYRVAPATHMIVEAGNAKYAYLDAASKILDSTERRYMVGVKWEATAKTTGSFKLGKLKKSFDLGVNPSSTFTAWDADVTWSPLTYSNVNFGLHQTANEASGVGSFMVSRDTNVQWTHGWSSFVTSTLFVADGVDNFQAATPARVDKRQGYGIGLTYVINRWLNAGIGYQNTKRSSNLAAANYTQSVSMLTLSGSL
jgi:polysaccharide biosynthesis protein VpsM